MSAYAAYETAILAMLDDASKVRYTVAMVQAALRQALLEYSLVRPLTLTYNVDGQNALMLEMPADFLPIQVIDVELHDPTTLPQTQLPFSVLHQDSSWFLVLQDLVTSKQSLDVTYSATHYVDGLDSAAGTSVLPEHEKAVQTGAAGYAALYRAVSRSESVNLQPGVQKALRDQAVSFLADFRAAIKPFAGTVFASMPPVPTDTF